MVWKPWRFGERQKMYRFKLSDQTGAWRKRHLLMLSINCYKSRTREKLEKAREKQHITYREITICITVGFSSETMMVSKDNGMALKS